MKKPNLNINFYTKQIRNNNNIYEVFALTIIGVFYILRINTMKRQQKILPMPLIYQILMVVIDI